MKRTQYLIMFTARELYTQTTADLLMMTKDIELTVTKIKTILIEEIDMSKFKNFQKN